MDSVYTHGDWTKDKMIIVQLVNRGEYSTALKYAQTIFQVVDGSRLEYLNGMLLILDILNVEKSP